MSTLTSPSSTDRIERSIHIKAPRSKVWQSLANAEEFGRWFGANLKGQAFAPGQQVKGPITISGYEHIIFDALIDRVQPETLMSYRWHPYAMDPAIDYSKEQRTLVTFTLKDADAGTLLTVVESGFDNVPPERRLIAYKMNSGGWEGQLKNIDRYVSSRNSALPSSASASTHRNP
ncbi:MAG: SRPBCC family protein [Casimicrobiaceae bacterium]